MIPADLIGGDPELDDPFGSIDALINADTTTMTDEAARLHALALHHAKARIDAAVIAATGTVDARGLHRGDGARTTGAWLTKRIDQTRGHCAADVRLARFLHTAPAAASAFRRGRIGRTKVDLLHHTHIPEITDAFHAAEATLVATIGPMLVRDAEIYLRNWQHMTLLAAGYIDPDHPIPGTPDIAIALTQTFDQRWDLTGDMDNDHGQAIRAALDTELDHMFHTGTMKSDDGLTIAERRGIALAQILSRHTLTTTHHDRPRPSIEVRVDHTTLTNLLQTGTTDDTDGEDGGSRVCEYLDGSPLALTTLARYLCHADITRILLGPDSEPLDVGKTRRSATRAQRRALRTRHDGHCAYPGCSAPDAWCQAHHIVHWNPDPTTPDGGTDLDNLVPLCDFHHHRVHALGLELTLHPDGTLDVHRPARGDRPRQPITPTLTHRRWRPPPRTAPAA